jgi:hypothetical protein
MEQVDADKVKVANALDEVARAVPRIGVLGGEPSMSRP